MVSGDRTPLNLRQFRPADLQTLYEIDQACFPPGISYSKEELAAFIDSRESKTWIAVEDDTIAGFLIGKREPDRVGHIVTVDVLEPWRRRGVGRALMQAVEAWARDSDLGLIYLETAQDNLVAQRFYQVLGYEKVDEIEDYYREGVAAWVMAKRLGPPTAPDPGGRST